MSHLPGHSRRALVAAAAASALAPRAEARKRKRKPKPKPEPLAWVKATPTEVIFAANNAGLIYGMSAKLWYPPAGPRDLSGTSFFEFGTPESDIRKFMRSGLASLASAILSNAGFDVPADRIDVAVV